MTRAEELAWVYQIDLMFFERYEEWFYSGRLTAAQARKKMENELRVLQAYKKEMELLPEDERPKEYYEELPVIPKEIYYTPAASDSIPDPVEQTIPEEHRQDAAAISKIPEEISGQVNILDWLGSKLF